MKKLQLYTGGHPFRLDDLNHLNSGMVETFAHMAKAFQRGTTPYILYGVEFTFSNGDLTLDWTAGAVVDANGEICEIEAGTATRSNLFKAFKFTSAPFYEDPENVLYAESGGVLKQVYFNQKYTFTVVSTVFVGDILHSNLKRFLHSENLSYASTNFTAGTGDWVVTNVNEEIKYQKIGQQVTVYVHITDSTINNYTNDLSIKLPESLTSGVEAVGIAQVNSEEAACYCYINEGSRYLTISKLDHNDFTVGNTTLIRATITYALR